MSDPSNPPLPIVSKALPPDLPPIDTEQQARDFQKASFVASGLTEAQAEMTLDTFAKIRAMVEELKAHGLNLCITVSGNNILGTDLVFHRPLPTSGLTIVRREMVENATELFIKALKLNSQA